MKTIVFFSFRINIWEAGKSPFVLHLICNAVHWDFYILISDFSLQWEIEACCRSTGEKTNRLFSFHLETNHILVFPSSSLPLVLCKGDAIALSLQSIHAGDLPISFFNDYWARHEVNYSKTFLVWPKAVPASVQSSSEPHRTTVFTALNKCIYYQRLSIAMKFTRKLLYPKKM